jgi:hypothetical protein
MWLRTGLGLLTISSYILALAARRADVQSWFGITVPAWVVPGAIALGTVGLVVIIAISVRTASVVAVASSTTILTRVRRPIRYECSVARSFELAKISKFCEAHFGLDTAALWRLERWHQKNDQLFRVIYRVAADAELEMVGCFRIIPLTAPAIKAVKKGQITGGKTIDTRDICRPSNKPTAIYIGGLVSLEGTTPRGVVFKKFKEAVEFELSRGVSVIYTRAATSAGMRLIKKYGFVPMDPAKSGIGPMYCLFNPNSEK